MAVIRTLLIILEAACSLALIGLILLQKSKSQGLGTAFGGGGNDSVLGARAGNVLTRATVGIGIVFLVNTLILGMLFAGSADQSLMDRVDSPPASAAPIGQPADAPAVPDATTLPVDE
ncbi:MAG TPA: preprotein translocase subunit SecG [Tichowtungia sp.]|nr:preprotein translocase subunit SecG [Tichowtungia sp.]